MKLFLISMFFFFALNFCFGEGNAQDMVFIRGGDFLMGSPADEPGREKDELQHKVKVSDFYLCETAVTFSEYDRFCEATSRKKPSDSGWGRDDRPVINVNWYDAVEFCNWKSIGEGLEPAYSISTNKDKDNIAPFDLLQWTVKWNGKSNGYRLPTEAEWEYAARAGTLTPFWTGANITTGQANYDGNWPYNNNPKGDRIGMTVPVKNYDPNPWGLYQMNGNVWQWCWDWSGDYEKKNADNPTGPVKGSSRVQRGGGWIYYGTELRSANRYCGNPSGKDYYLGFRLARSINK